MELYFFRHGIAVERGTPDFANDFDRPLTPEGTKKVSRIVRALQKLELTFEWIVSSPYVRARQTAELLAAEYVRANVELSDGLRADADPRAILPRLKQLEKKGGAVVLVGHEPNLSTLASLMITGVNRSCLTLKKAGMIKLTVDSVQVGRCASLEWLLTPRQMIEMG